MPTAGRIGGVIDFTSPATTRVIVRRRCHRQRLVLHPDGGLDAERYAPLRRLPPSALSPTPSAQPGWPCCAPRPRCAWMSRGDFHPPRAGEMVLVKGPERVPRHPAPASPRRRLCRA